jgi:hypothetical protein
MNPILQNLAGMIFLLTAESGVLIQGFTRHTERTKDFVYNAALGYDTGFVGYNPKATYNLKGQVTGSSGIAAAAPCVSLAVANVSFGNGVGTSGADNGGIYTDTTELGHQPKAFREMTVTATQNPGIA